VHFPVKRGDNKQEKHERHRERESRGFGFGKWEREYPDMFVVCIEKRVLMGFSCLFPWKPKSASKNR